VLTKSLTDGYVASRLAYETLFSTALLFVTTVHLILRGLVIFIVLKISSVSLRLLLLKRCFSVMCEIAGFVSCFYFGLGWSFKIVLELTCGCESQADCSVVFCVILFYSERDISRF
jgi:hypothetical protein